MGAPETLPYSDHTEAPECWCGPVLEWTTADGTEVWVHRDLEKRTRPPAAVIAEAIAWAAEAEEQSDG